MTEETQVLRSMSEESFDIVMRGYSRQQVDEYVATTRERIQDLEHQLTTLEDELQTSRRREAEAKRRLEGHSPTYDELGGRLSEILKLAEQEAEAKVRDADGQARKIKRDSEERATRLKEDAEKKVMEAETFARQRLDVLQREHGDLVQRMTSMRDAMQDVLDRAGAGSPKKEATGTGSTATPAAGSTGTPAPGSPAKPASGQSPGN